MLNKSNRLWITLSQIGGVIVLLPFVFLCVNLLVPSNENWATLSQYWLKQYITNTLILVTGVGLVVAALGSGLAFWGLLRIRKIKHGKQTGTDLDL